MVKTSDGDVMFLKDGDTFDEDVITLVLSNNKLTITITDDTGNKSCLDKMTGSYKIKELFD